MYHMLAIAFNCIQLHIDFLLSSDIFYYKQISSWAKDRFGDCSVNSHYSRVIALNTQADEEN